MRSPILVFAVPHSLFIVPPLSYFVQSAKTAKRSR
jgi:hypothetical protein